MENISNRINTYIPEKDPLFIPFGNYFDLEKIIDKRIFNPFYLVGPSGCGKTKSITQICNKLGREMVRVNITAETDEDDLLGGFRLENGQTVWKDGPVVLAMKAGAVLLLDEIDLGSSKLMCLQPILEGEAVYLKKINQLVIPKPGFNIAATANTKGKGSDDGRFIGTNVQNEALLDRFLVTFTQGYPDEEHETKILNSFMTKLGNLDEQFIKVLITWANKIRKSFENQDSQFDETISTRRLVAICQAFYIFDGDRTKAINVCIDRFDDDTKSSMMKLYETIDEELAKGVQDTTGELEEDEEEDEGYLFDLSKVK